MRSRIRRAVSSPSGVRLYSTLGGMVVTTSRSTGTASIGCGGKGLSEVATELGLSPGQLSAWRNEHLAAGSADALAARKAEQAELQRLKRENKRLEEEVEILKKAAAFFARGIA